MIADKIRASIADVLNDGRFIGGPWVERLEDRLRDVVDLPCVTVGSGTDALTLAVMATVTRRHGRIAVPAATFSATASAVVRAGFEPVLVDIDDETSNISWSQVQGIAESIDAVIPVHLFGRLVDLPPALPCPIIEDACQAFGNGMLGTIGKISAVSFFPSKPLGCYGDGGAVFGSEELISKVRLLARHGARDRYLSEVCGFNSRLDAIQAAILLVKLDYVDAAWIRRSLIASRYTDAIRAIDDERRSLSDRWLAPWGGTGHAWHIYAMRCTSRRDAILGSLLNAGVEVVVQYPALHRQPAFADCGRAGPLLNAERLDKEVISLPIWSGMTDAQVDYVTESLRRAAKL